MEGETSVKIEPEEDLEYNLKHDEKFEIMSEIDLPIKSEEGFKEEFKDYQQPECWTGPITLPPIKEELPKLQENLTLSIPIKQYCTSQAKINETSRKFNIVKSSDTIWYLSDKLQWKDM
uniref:Uncharacterized protein n=1 Tax=Timema monikensis TaxID=170555 RepID=A0A7R9EJ79_9NEOP|nr:unnamed protein product [Timema monikensis]